MAENPRDLPIDQDLLTEGVAIIGMSCRFPGARTVDEFWANLINGVESLERVSDEELIAKGVSPDVLKDPRYVPVSGSLPDVEMFDAGYFGFSPKDAAITDPQHRHFLECAVEAFEEAGHSTRRFDGAIGVFAGCGMNSYFINNLLTNPDMIRTVGAFLLRHTGNDRDFLPTTVSYKLDLRGPSMAIQTACSTSLVAIHAACQSLLSGECDMALAGGSTILVPNGEGYYYRDNEPVSPDGHCRPFEANSAGTVLTSGTGAVVLRRLEDAIADGDRIHAVIRGSAVNNDGAGKIGYLAPSVEGHAAAVSEALTVANVPAETISYVEAHGTGTRVGDPIEIAALTQAFRASTNKTQFCRIGSVKSNIGHLDTAAGVASLIKVVKSLEAGELAPTLHFKAPNPEIDFESTPFIVNAERRDWSINGGPRRAGVSSLGIGGTNAHVVLEEAPKLPASSVSHRTRQVLTLSAKSRNALSAARINLARWLRENPNTPLADVAYTLQEGRDYWDHRLVLTADSAEDAAAELENEQSARVAVSKCDGESKGVAFMFSGAGGQYPNMGRELYECEPTFRNAMDQCFGLLAELVDFDVRSLIYPEPGLETYAEAELRKPSRLCPAIVSVQWSLVQLWKSWGIQPTGMIGHSLGEYVAACVSGVFSLENMLRIVVLRGNLIDSLTGGAMVSLPLSESEARKLIGDDIDLAAINSPGLCVASGARDHLENLCESLKAKEIEARLIPVDAAGHSRHLDPILEPFRQGLVKVKLSSPKLPYVSNVTGTWVRGDEVTDPEYWVRHLRGTVRFSEGLRELLERDRPVLLEVGPGQSLCAFARQQPDKPPAIVPSLRKIEDRSPDQEFAMSAFGKIWAGGFDVEWGRLRDPDERRLRVRLPSYPFEHSPYWVEPGISRASETERSKFLSKLDSIDDWTRTLTWNAAPLRSTGDLDWQGTWLVFLDQVGIGQRIADRLRAEGQDVTTVRMADTFFQLTESDFALSPERGIEGYEQLVAALSAEAKLPERIVHLWSVTTEEAFRPGSSFLDRNQECGFYSLLYLTQALGEAAESVSDIVVVTNGVAAVNREEVLLYPDKATVLGPVRVIPREIPTSSCRCIDVSFRAERPGGLRSWLGLESLRADDEQINRLVDKLYQEIGSTSDASMVALRDAGRFEEVMTPSPLPDGVEATSFRKGGVYLITGGLGGLGFALAERIGLEQQAKLVLLGRSAFPDEKSWDDWLAAHADQDGTAEKIKAIRRIREAGGDVLILSVDVTDAIAVRGAVEEAEAKFGKIEGVLHTAGSVSDGLLQTKSKEDAEITFSAKLYGTLVLDKVFEDRSLDFFVLFSSTSAVIGLPGQIDYAAANAFLNAFAERRNRLGKPTLAIGWGIWNDVGGAASLARQLRHEPKTPGLLRPTRHPLLGNCIESTRDSWAWESDLSARDLWVLDEHRTGTGVALLPGTAYLEIAHAAYQEVAEERTCHLENVAFLQPLIVPDDQPVRISVRMARHEGKYEISVWNALTDTEYACMSVGPAKSDTRSIDTETIVRRCQVNHRVVGPSTPAIPSSQEAQLSFGPRWSVLQEVGVGHNESYARLKLREEFQGDTEQCSIHPAILDIATSFGIPLIPDWKSGNATYVPLEYESVQILAPIGSEVFAHVVSRPDNSFEREVATFDVTISDMQGLVLMRIGGYQMRKLSNDNAFASGSVSAKPGANREPSPMETVFLEAYDGGIQLDEGMQILNRSIAQSEGGVIIVSPLNIDDWQNRIHSACNSAGEGSTITFGRPELDTEFEPPRSSVDEKLVSIWRELLGVDQIGIRDDFFDLGGHSLIAVRMFAKLKNQWGVDWPISILFDAPNIAALSDLLAEEVGAEGDAGEVSRPSDSMSNRYRYLVAMNRPAKDTTRHPLFLVAGMFGNVLNLRHLATHLGKDQPVYALQAKGLYGEDEPHGTFVDAAKDYINEMRQVQPSGPYLIGGFSGGGVTAFEIAHQLLTAGEEVGAVIMLDSIPPHPAWPEPDLMERLQIKAQRVRKVILREPIAWLKARVKWQLERFGVLEMTKVQQTPAEFRSEQIEIAFRLSLDRYEMRKLPLEISLFRPELDRTYVLWNGRIANSNGQLMEHENWWTPWVNGVEVTVVPGNHDSMVLEPNVQRLASHVRTVLDDAHLSTARNVQATKDNEPANGEALINRGMRYAS